MEAGIERLTALVFIILGLSHVAAPRVWVRFFIDMRAKGDVAGLLNAFVHLPLGLLILAFHPVWSGSGLLVTLIGCGLTLKGTLYGSARPRIDLLNLIELHRSGHLMLDELLTRTYPLEQINEAYEALERGEVARSLIVW